MNSPKILKINNPQPSARIASWRSFLCSQQPRDKNVSRLGRQCSKFVVNSVIWPFNVVHVIISPHLLLLVTIWKHVWLQENVRISEFQNPTTSASVSCSRSARAKSSSFSVLSVSTVVRSTRSKRSARGAERCDHGGTGGTSKRSKKNPKMMSDIVMSYIISYIKQYPTTSIDQTQSSIDTTHGQPLKSFICAICLAAIISFQLSFG